MIYFDQYGSETNQAVSGKHPFVMLQILRPKASKTHPQVLYKTLGVTLIIIKRCNE